MIRARTTNGRCARQQRGFTLLETGMVLVVAGLLSWAGFSAYQSVSDQQARNQAQAMAREMQASLRSFSIRQGRLPCPDTSAAGSGYEALTGTVCSPGNQIGWFPYVSVGMGMPIEALRGRYAVFRAANAVAGSDADLAVAKERTDDPVNHANHLDVTDLMRALNNASGLALDTSHAYLTGDGAIAGAIDCTGNAVMNVAYWLVVPVKDRSGDQIRLDPPHTLTNLCAQSPSAPIRTDSDDVVLSESPAQLAGWLRKSLP
jgi:hypothetical protein